MIGVSDNGALVGLMREIELFFKGSRDKFVNCFKDKIKTNFDERFLPLIDLNDKFVLAFVRNIELESFFKFNTFGLSGV